MRVLENIEPKSVFYFFEELCKIPHGSTNSKPIADWLVEFAKNRGLEYYRDNSDNVIIIKEAVSGYETKEPVILQGHTDMVCQKAPDCKKDMEKEGLDLDIDGDFVFAKGTTLGADNGIAVSMMLAVLDSSDLKHPRIEAVFTSDEEIGLLGASSVDLSNLKANRLINLDSEDEGIFTVSCAGGNRTQCSIPISREEFDGKTVKIKVSGLCGGHSGIEIDKGRANADILIGRILYDINKKTNMRLVSVNGGLKDNAIVNEAEAQISVFDEAEVFKAVKESEEFFKAEYNKTEPDLKLITEACDYSLPMSEKSTKDIITFLMCAPNGIEAMSSDIEGLVQTSLNLGVLNTSEHEVVASFCVRSSKESKKEMLTKKLSCITEALGGKTEVFGDYPGWDYAENSPLRDLMIEVFKEQYGYEPKIEAIHAGLECGILASKKPGLDCISIGPDLREVHTYREKMSVSSVERTWKLIVSFLQQ